MIVPSIDIAEGKAVQLRGGRELVIDAGDPLAVAERFAVAGELAVIDLDAARGRGDNSELIARLVRRYSCRVGGGIRSREAALRWLDAGAERVILGTAAEPELLAQLPRERVIAALDAVDGEVLVEGWQKRSGSRVEQRIDALRRYVGGFLLTFIEREGRLQGTDLARAEQLVERAAPAQVTIAGGVTSAEEVAALDRLGADAQVGMALYSGQLELGDAIAAPLRSDRPDGLWPTVVCDERGVALGLCYSDGQSVRRAVAERRGIYRSRSRGLWVKGERSGDTQQLLRLEPDCDRDALRAVVRQQGRGWFCHRETRDCFSPPAASRREGRGLGSLERRLGARLAAGADDQAAAGSYTRRLAGDPQLLAAKLAEEADELGRAEQRDEVIWEAADVLYFTLVAMARSGVTLAEVEAELARRSLRVTRRPGDAKPAAAGAAGVQRPQGDAAEPAELAKGAIEADPEQRFAGLRRVSPADVRQLSRTVVDRTTLIEAERIVEAVRAEGRTAVERYAARFGDRPTAASARPPLLLGREPLERAAAQLDPDKRALLERAAERVRSFARAQRAAIGALEQPIAGGVCGHRALAVRTAGCYAPSGRFPLPSTVLMTAVTARAAGVERVFVASPRPDPTTLAAAAIAGADGLLCAGGAQAIAAFAFGLDADRAASEPALPRCDVIAGPGNRWVTAAKQLLAGEVGIDLLAGPSELVVVADSSADPQRVAADLLAQAEHDPDARPLLIATDGALLDAVDRALARQLDALPAPSQQTANAAIANGGLAVLAGSLEQAFALSDELAPEHLQLSIANARELADRPRSYGALFIGEQSSETLGDYCAGPNHCLPTGTSARYSSGLSVLSFLRLPTYLRIDDPAAAAELYRDAESLAELEGLTAHRRAAALRR